jgi:predicted nuclease of restriction endonuclease-like (RecB) superfamily
VDNLEWFRQFYVGYPGLLAFKKSDAVRRICDSPSIVEAARQLSARPPSFTGAPIRRTPPGESLLALILAEISDPARRKSWQPGQLHSNLSWTHYRTLLRVEKPEVRSFYEIEAIQNNWSARELERQINSLLYERLALSKDKKGLLRLAKKGHEIQRPVDVFKDPIVIEFLGLPESHRLVESKLEEALITNLQAFLLELGKGFAFVARQERITPDGDHFYIDLVFYHTILKCYVLIDLLVGKLTHEDIGQLQLYVNYYDQERCTPGDNLTLGLILCTDKNDAVVRYTLGPQQQRKIFASRYKLHLPTEAELEAEIRRELKQLKQDQRSDRIE